jgi:hypothetical protein
MNRRRANLFLGFSYCYVTMLLYCPFLHHILKPCEQRSPSANSAALRCVEAAIETVRLAEVMETQGVLYEAYAFTIDLIAMASTSLLVVELGAPGDLSIARVKSSSKNAKMLLERLALRNCAAARCLESLTVSIIHLSEDLRSQWSLHILGLPTDIFCSRCSTRPPIAQEFSLHQPID